MPARKGPQGVWGVEDLRKRPAPTSAPAEPLIEVAGFTSGTDWGTSYTVLDFTDWGSGPYVSYPNTVESVDWASIDLNAGSNIILAKGGVYTIDVYFTNYVNNAGVTTVRLLEVRTISGETPAGYGASAWSTGHYGGIISRVQDAQAGGIIDAAPDVPPGYFHDWMILQADAFGVGTAGVTEIQIRAYKEEDEVGVSETQVVTRVFIARLGAVYE